MNNLDQIKAQHPGPWTVFTMEGWSYIIDNNEDDIVGVDRIEKNKLQFICDCVNAVIAPKEETGAITLDGSGKIGKDFLTGPVAVSMSTSTTTGAMHVLGEFPDPHTVPHGWSRNQLIELIKSQLPKPTTKEDLCPLLRPLKSQSQKPE